MPRNWFTAAVAWGKEVVVPMRTPSGMMAVAGSADTQGVTANKDKAAVASATKGNMMKRKERIISIGRYLSRNRERERERQREPLTIYRSLE